MDSATSKTGQAEAKVLTFEDMDLFNAAVARWDLEFRQIERGTIDACVAQRQTASTNFNRVRFSRAVAQAGAPSPGVLTFGFVEAGSWTRWCGHDVQPWQLLRFTPAHEFESISTGGFSAFTMSLPAAPLNSLAQRLGHSEVLEESSTGRFTLNTSSTDLNRLHHLVRGAIAADSPDPALDEVMETDIAIELITVLAGLDVQPCDSTAKARGRVVQDAVEYILDNAQDPPTVVDVCAATRVSLRTLNRAFREKLGASPKDCIMSTRLQGVRRELREASHGTLVADVANRWGFWHLGDFARKYRTEFGELPSMTRAPRTL